MNPGLSKGKKTEKEGKRGRDYEFLKLNLYHTTCVGNIIWILCDALVFLMVPTLTEVGAGFIVVLVGLDLPSGGS